MIIKRIFSFSQSLPRWQRLIIFIALFAIGIIFYPEFGCKIKTLLDFLGLGDKNLWDWLELAVVPLSLALIGFRFQAEQSKENKKERALQREREINERQEQREREADERKAEILQVYFDRISRLLIDKNLIDRIKRAEAKENPDSQKGYLIESCQSIIRARTLSILRSFSGDPERKAAVIRFLIETDILREVKVSLSKANLSGADLSGADLRGADLSKADLSYARLVGAKFFSANLCHADLNGANLCFAELSGAILHGVNLSGANLHNADLNGANLFHADLNGANLWAADLSGAILCFAELSGAILHGVNLSGHDLSGAKLRKADLSGHDLSGANLRGADLSGANLRGADLSGANLRMLRWDEKTQWPEEKAFDEATGIPEDLKRHLGL